MQSPSVPHDFHSPSVYLRQHGRDNDPSIQLLHNNSCTKDTAFNQQEREKYGILGLLPPTVETLKQQERRAMSQFRFLEKDMNKYVFLSQLKQRNETLFYRCVIDNLEETLPIVYTPTVGAACQNFDMIWRGAEGMYISHLYKGKIRKILDNWKRDVDIIVVTDGSRILGLGDLGINGMGIPIGKLSLYVAAAGFHPTRTLPVTIDVGTNNRSLLDDPLYLGSKIPRLNDHDFHELIQEFVDAVRDKWPSCLIQFEDFSTPHCFELLEKHRERALCFNDDIQGTGSVVAAGFLNAAKWSGIKAEDHRLVFLGAGSAGIGVADSIVSSLVHLGVAQDKARKIFYFVDSKGLVTNKRDNIEAHKKNYVRSDMEECGSLLETIKAVKPTGLIGLSGQGGSFSQDILTELAKNTEKPVIFALSNPTSKAECTAQQAYDWTGGKCVFASGSPFPPVQYRGETFYPGQGNNMYIFPGLGFGAVLARATKVSEAMIGAATTALASFVTEDQLSQRMIYPKLSDIRQISCKIAAAVINQAVSEKLGRYPKGINANSVEEYVRNSMYEPVYLE